MNESDKAMFDRLLSRVMRPWFQDGLSAEQVGDYFHALKDIPMDIFRGGAELLLARKRQEGAPAYGDFSAACEQFRREADAVRPRTLTPAALNRDAARKIIERLKRGAR